MSRGKIAFGAVIGAVAGIIAGVLTAPKSGKETRADLREKADELKQDAAARMDAMKARTDRSHDNSRGTDVEHNADKV